ncbi:MAG: S9 family peptidase [Gammaproteobacteria bacterium]
MRRLLSVAIVASIGFASMAVGETTATKPETDTAIDPVIERLLAIRSISGLSVSPDGSQAVYVLSRNDLKKDTSLANLWLVDVESGENRQLTSSREGESSPQWRPDGKAVGFLSSRHDPDEGTTQVWVLPLNGGEATRVTDVKGDVEDFTFSPDGKKLALIILPPDPFEAPDDDEDIQTAPPIVIDRFAFKTDAAGYLTRDRELFLADIASGEMTQLAANVTEPLLPSFSPNGKSMAFVAKGGEDPDRTDAYHVYLVDPVAGAEAAPIVQTEAAQCHADSGQRPEWSPNGRTIACILLEYDRDGYYSQYDLALIDVRKGTAQNLTADFDLNVDQPEFSADGRWVWVTIERDRTVQLARIRTKTGEIEPILGGPLTVEDFGLGGGDRVVAAIGHSDTPIELYAVDVGDPRRITRHNDEMIASHPWQSAEEISFKSPDGTEIHGLLLRPAGASTGQRHPTALWLHGGPVSQFSHRFRTTPQLLAAHGYAVVLVNPRGSSGRGLLFSKVLSGAWGSVDVPDVLAGIDHVVEMGVADPDRLVVGGWSYGGMLTNYVIASDTRFKAAASGASIGNAWAGFGTDMYVREYLSELGTPWDHPEAYDRVSYPFMKADRIVTPTLFSVGEKDYNVPLLASEQMYQALKVLRVPTQLVIYPGQSHSPAPPSHSADIWQRYLDWFNQHLAD